MTYEPICWSNFEIPGPPLKLLYECLMRVGDLLVIEIRADGHLDIH